jgi:hypothetical protein
MPEFEYSVYQNMVMGTLDSSQIRHLIFTANWEVVMPNSFTIFTVADTIIGVAVQRGFLRRKPELLAERSAQRQDF